MFGPPALLKLFKLYAYLPLWLAHAIGWGLGWLVFLCVPAYRTQFLANARQAGLRWHQWRGAVGAAGQMLSELPRLWLGPKLRVRWTNAAQISQALQAGKGVVFLTPHLGCFEATARAYAERFGQSQQPITVLYRPPRQAWLRQLVSGARARAGLQTAPTTLAGAKQMLRALRQGQSLGLLPDQVPPEGMGTWSAFFNRPAYTMTLSARLALQTQATVLVAWGERLSWGRGYCVHVQATPLVLPNDTQQAVDVLNQVMAALILTCPQQYLWGYQRYKAPRSDA